MRKIYLLFSVIAMFTQAVNGQSNLVLNPGFENYTACPGTGQFTGYVDVWIKPNIASSDYYNMNCPLAPANEPPRNGEGYAGIICYNYGSEYREYITGTLTSALVQGSNYKVEFYVSLNDGYVRGINEVGAYLSSFTPGPFSTVTAIPVTPQITNTNGPLISKTGWTKISGTFTATGGEQYITIGNFNTDSTTTVSNAGGSGMVGAYYFVEDVSVILDSSTTAVYPDLFSLSSAKIFPNPSADGIFTVSFDQFSDNAILEVYNTLGEKAYTSPLSIWRGAGGEAIDLSSQPKGIYFLKLSAGDKMTTQKIIITQ